MYELHDMAFLYIALSTLQLYNSTAWFDNNAWIELVLTTAQTHTCLKCYTILIYILLKHSSIQNPKSFLTEVHVKINLKLEQINKHIINLHKRNANLLESKIKLQGAKDRTAAQTNSKSNKWTENSWNCFIAHSVLSHYPVVSQLVYLKFILISLL